MTIQVIRKISNDKATISEISLDGTLIAYGLEDGFRKEKKAGETRIPAGIYNITTRLFGKFYEQYKQKFAWHRGVLELRNVPQFTDILIHIGNTNIDTRGCLLVGESATLNLGNYALANSTIAYAKFYKQVIKDAEKGTLNIHIIDKDI